MNDLPIVPTAPALVTNTSAWWAGAPSSFGSGWLGVWRMDLALGSSPKTTPLAEGGSCAADASVAVLAPLAALPVGLPGGATVGLVTARGCVVAVRADTSEVWRLDLAPPGGGDVATLAVDAETARGFVLTGTGALCCVDFAAAGGGVCSGWLASCVTLPPHAGAAFLPGLALSPALDFSEREVFALDAAGYAFAVSAATGALLAAAVVAAPGGVAGPVLAPRSLDGRYSALLAAGGDGSLAAFYVGTIPSGADDDDAGSSASSDDDAGGVGAAAWRISALPTPAPAAAAAAGAAAPALSAGFAVRSDGSILLPLTDGTIVVVSPAQAAKAATSTAVVNAVIAVLAVCVTLATALTIFCACRKRMKRRAAKAAADALLQAGGDGLAASEPHAVLPVARGDGTAYVAMK